MESCRSRSPSRSSFLAWAHVRSRVFVNHLYPIEQSLSLCPMKTFTSPVSLKFNYTRQIKTERGGLGLERAWTSGIRIRFRVWSPPLSSTAATNDSTPSTACNSTQSNPRRVNLTLTSFLSTYLPWRLICATREVNSIHYPRNTLLPGYPVRFPIAERNKLISSHLIDPNGRPRKQQLSK